MEVINKINIKELHNIHLNKMCFVIGSGPSLHFNNYNLENYVSITINSSILKFPSCDYFLSDDIGISDWDFFWNFLPKNNCKKLFYYNKLKDYLSLFKENEVFCFEHRDWKNGEKVNYEGLKVKNDPETPIIGARTSAASAINIAYIMGCDPIVLLGLDCCCVNGKNYFWEFPNEPKPKRIKNFIPVAPASYEMKGKKLTRHSKEFLEYWSHFKIANSDLNIINATQNSLLEEFQKMEYKKVIDTYATRTK